MIKRNNKITVKIKKRTSGQSQSGEGLRVGGGNGVVEGQGGVKMEKTVLE